MAESTELALNLRKGDAPLDVMADDEFGLKEVVEALAGTLAKRVKADGFTLGVEGPWGSGKSSFVNFVAEKLEQFDEQYVLRFEPWLVGEKNALLAAFFGQFASLIDNMETERSSGWAIDRWRRGRIRSRLSNQIRKYGESIGILATPIGGLAAADPTGATALAAVGLKTVGLFSRLFGTSPSVEALKSQIVSGLKNLGERHPNIRITVIIDDTDRLEPAEAVEILRLVRKVADFPFTTYLICFDGNVLSSQVSKVLQIEDGRLFIEKIFQDIVHIPPQEPFALRRYLKRKLQQSFPSEMAARSDDNDYQYRKHLIFDQWSGELIKTPRDVNRLHEAIAFTWPNLPRESDFFDYLWLQLIKQKSHELYNWTQTYLQSVGAYRDGGRPAEREPREQALRLTEIMKKYQWSERVYLSGLDKILPGVSAFAMEGEKKEVFAFESGELELFERGKRLGSPSHWRWYFALDLPSYAIRDNEVTAFRDAAQSNPSEAVKLLAAIFEKLHEKVGHFLDMLLDRLLDLPDSSISAEEAHGTMSAFAATMDDVALKSGEFETAGVSEIWRKTSRLLRKKAANKFSDVVTNGQSINWLAYIIRDQGFAHGLPQGRKQYPDNQWLTKDQLEEAIGIITTRLQKIGMKKVFALPHPPDVLFCWLQLGDRDVVRKLFATAIQSDAGFLLGMRALRGWANSSNAGVRHPLHAEYVALYMDEGAALERLESLAEKEGVSQSFNRRAKELLAEWEKAPKQIPY